MAEMPVEQRPEAVNAPSRLQWGLAFAIAAIYLLVTLSAAFIVLPESDEAAYANPGYNLDYAGHMGMTVFELRGYLPLSSADHCYWQPPLYFLLTAATYKIAGFSLAAVRLLSVLFGLITLGSWFVLTLNLTRSPKAALFVAALIAVDFFFLTRAAHGRMDLVCVGLGSAGLAIYAALRNSRPGAAMFWGNALEALALLTHPVGVVWVAALFLLILFLDRRHLSFRLIALLAAPYLIGGAGALAYVLEDPTAFREQMQGILALTQRIFYDPNLSHIKAVQYLQQEILSRYLAPFGFRSGVSPASRLKIIILLAYLGGVFGILLLKKLRSIPGVAWYSSAFIAAFFLLAEVSPSKFHYYLPHTTVFMAACLGIFLYESGLASSARSMFAVLALIGGIQLAGVAYYIHQNNAARDYAKVVSLIERETPPDSLVMASNEFWFSLSPARRVLNDHYLGFLSGLRPTVIVMSQDYDVLYRQDQRDNPAAYQYETALLQQSKLLYHDESYDVYGLP